MQAIFAINIPQLNGTLMYKHPIYNSALKLVLQSVEGQENMQHLLDTVSKRTLPQSIENRHSPLHPANHLVAFWQGEAITSPRDVQRCADAIIHIWHKPNLSTGQCAIK